ncbi:MAG: outer membrane lipoprotein-sorting protein [bacterium]
MAVSQDSDDDIDADYIMYKMDNLEDGDTAIMDLTMVLINRAGNKKIRKLKAFRKDYGKDSKSLAFFLTPADVKNTAFLGFNWDDLKKEDDIWIYLPALHKAKRIASSNKKDAYMGSDFSYADINGLDIRNWQHSIKESTDEVDGYACWVIESVPKDNIKEKVINETGYIKTLTWVRKDNFIMVQRKIWVKQGNRVKYLKASDIEKIQDIWTTKKMKMITTKNNRKEHESIFIIDKISYNQEMNDNIFTLQHMERGLNE